MLDRLKENNKKSSPADHLPICLRSDKYSIASSSDIFFLLNGVENFYLIFLLNLVFLKLFVYLTTFFKIFEGETVYSFGINFVLASFLNLRKTEFAAATLIC